MSTPQPVIAIYRVKPDQEDAFFALLRKHHPTLVELGLATDDPPVVYRGEVRDEEGPIVFELFSWKDASSPNVAHQTPEVAKVWEAMGTMCAERNGRPKFMFPHVERVSPGGLALKDEGRSPEEAGSPARDLGA